MTSSASAVAVPAFRSRQFLVRLGTPEGLFDVLRIIFMKDGSYAVSFCAFHDAHGVAARCTLPAGRARQSVSLLDAGSVTSHLVKFTHHESGIAQFSLTGRVRTDIRRRSVALAALDGHAWTVMLRDPTGLRRSARPIVSAVSAKEQVLTFTFTRPSTDAFKLVGWQHPERELARHLPSLPTKASFLATGLDGTTRPMFILAPPADWIGGGRAMLITAEDLSNVQASTTDHLVFIGGFDEPRVLRDERVATEFLALSYPAKDFETLARAVGSLDLLTTPAAL